MINFPSLLMNSDSLSSIEQPLSNITGIGSTFDQTLTAFSLKSNTIGNININSIAEPTPLSTINPVIGLQSSICKQDILQEDPFPQQVSIIQPVSSNTTQNSQQKEAMPQTQSQKSSSGINHFPTLQTNNFSKNAQQNQRGSNIFGQAQVKAPEIMHHEDHLSIQNGFKNNPQATIEPPVVFSQTKDEKIISRNSPPISQQNIPAKISTNLLNQEIPSPLPPLILHEHKILPLKNLFQTPNEHPLQNKELTFLPGNTVTIHSEEGIIFPTFNGQHQEQLIKISANSTQQEEPQQTTTLHKTLPNITPGISHPTGKTIVVESQPYPLPVQPDHALQNINYLPAPHIIPQQGQHTLTENSPPAPHIVPQQGQHTLTENIPPAPHIIPQQGQHTLTENIPPAPHSIPQQGQHTLTENSPPAPHIIPQQGQHTLTENIPPAPHSIPQQGQHTLTENIPPAPHSVPQQGQHTLTENSPPAPHSVPQQGQHTLTENSPPAPHSVPQQGQHTLTENSPPAPHSVPQQGQHTLTENIPPAPHSVPQQGQHTLTENSLPAPHSVPQQGQHTLTENSPPAPHSVPQQGQHTLTENSLPAPHSVPQQGQHTLTENSPPAPHSVPQQGQHTLAENIPPAPHSIPQQGQHTLTENIPPAPHSIPQQGQHTLTQSTPPENSHITTNYPIQPQNSTVSSQRIETGNTKTQQTEHSTSQLSSMLSSINPPLKSSQTALQKPLANTVENQLTAHQSNTWLHSEVQITPQEFHHSLPESLNSITNRTTVRPLLTSINNSSNPINNHSGLFTNVQNVPSQPSVPPDNISSVILPQDIITNDFIASWKIQTFKPSSLGFTGIQNNNSAIHFLQTTAEQPTDETFHTLPNSLQEPRRSKLAIGPSAITDPLKNNSSDILKQIAPPQSEETNIKPISKNTQNAGNVIQKSLEIFSNLQTGSNQNDPASFKSLEGISPLHSTHLSGFSKINAVQFQNPVFTNLSASVIEQVRTALTTTKNKISLHLKPQHLGKMEINLTSTKGMVSASILVEKTITKDLLGNNIQNLRDVLAERGINVDKIEITVPNNSSTFNNNKSDTASNNDNPFNQLQQNTGQNSGSHRNFFQSNNDPFNNSLFLNEDETPQEEENKIINSQDLNTQVLLNNNSVDLKV